MNLLRRVLQLLAFTSLLSCTDEEVPVFDGIEAKLVAYDEMNVERTSFTAGEDITLGLVLVNTTATDIKAGTYFDYCKVYEIDEFLLLYKRIISDTGNESWQPVGKPYVPPISCATVATPVVVPANGKTAIAGAKWSNNASNSALGPGSYYTSVFHTLDINGESLELHLRLDFELH